MADCIKQHTQPIPPHYDIVLLDREDEPDDWRSGSNEDWMDELGVDEA